MRYVAPDDFGAPENAFLACNFWYIDALHQHRTNGRGARAVRIDFGEPQRLWAPVRRHSPGDRRALGQPAPDLFHGRHHQHRGAIVVELGGRMGPRLIIVSNRVAVPDPAGAPVAGGMAVAVKAALKNRDGMWFGWSGNVTDEPDGEPRTVEVNKITYVLIDLSKTDIQEYYNGLANSVLWPILHYRVDLQEYSRADASGYMRVNRMFADRLSALVARGRRRLDPRLSSDAARPRTAFARPPQQDRLLPPYALRAAGHPADPSASSRDSRRPDLLRSRRLPDGERPRQFRPLPFDPGRDADARGL